MASVSNDPNGSRRILFVDPSGVRKTFRVKCDRRTAEGIARHVEALLASRIAGLPVPRDTAAWLTTIADPLREKLVRAGLIDGEPEASAVPTIKGWCADYIAGRTDLATRSIARLEYSGRLLVEHFGPERRLDTVTAGDADDYSRWLARTRAPNTVRRQLGWARQFFGAAVRHELLTRNVFAGLAANTRPDRSKDHFVTREEIAKVLDAAPDVQWRAIIVLCRFAGLRCPSEVLALRWPDVLWDQKRMTVPNIKTAGKTGQAFRVVPLFPEVAAVLEEAFALADEGDEYIITRYRDCNANLRTQLGRIARKAGVPLWRKPFMNMRASRATELAQTYPGYVVAAWLGHTEKIAEAHYWQTTEAHFQAAAAPAAPVAQNPAQQVQAGSSTGENHEPGEMSEGDSPQVDATPSKLVHGRTVNLPGVEPPSLPGLDDTERHNNCMLSEWGLSDSTAGTRSTAPPGDGWLTGRPSRRIVPCERH